MNHVPTSIRSHALVAGIFAAHLAILVGLPAQAAPTPEVERTIAFLELREGPDSNSLTLDYLSEIQRTFQAENKGDYIYVPTSQIRAKVGKDRQQLPRALTPERRTMLSEAKKKGIAYLDRADAAHAIEALAAAAGKYRAALAAPGADAKLRGEYLDILAQLATAYVLAKNTDKAAEVFRIVITTFGLKARVTDDYYRPDVVAIFNRVVRDTKEMDNGKIDVASTPPGAHIIVNGVDRGATPATVPDLIPGVYSVHVSRGADTSMLHRVRVEGGKTTRLQVDLPLESHLVLEQGSVGLSYRDLDEVEERVPIDALAVGRILGVNLVVVTGVIDRHLATFFIDVNHSKMLRSGGTSVPQVGLSKRAVTKVMTLIKGGGAGGGEPWYTYKPGWYVAGGGALMLTIGLIYMPALLASKTFYQCPDVKRRCANPSPDYKRAAEDAKASYDADQAPYRLLSGAGLGLGLVLAGVSGYLFYRHVHSGGLAFGPLPSPSAMRALLPPSGFGERPVVFPLRL